MNQTEPTTKPKRSIGRWLIMLALVLVSVPVLLLLGMIGLYFSSRSASIEMQDRALVAERLAAELQSHQAATPPQLSTPAAFAPAAAEQIDASIVQVRVEFPDFGSRTADALIIDDSLIIDETRGVTLLTAPSSIFAPITGKVNGRMLTRQPALIVLNDVSIMMPASGFSTTPASVGMPGMMGAPSVQAREVAIASPMPRLGLTLLRTQTDAKPLRIRGDFAKAEVGEALSVRQRSMGNLPPTKLTVLDTDAAVADTAGQQLDHLLKLTAWHDALGGIVCNSKGDPIGQIVLTVTEQSGSSFTYAAPLGRIFDEYYAQTAESAEAAPTGPGSSGDMVRAGIAPGPMAEAIPPLGPGAENADPFAQPLRTRSVAPELTPPIQKGAETTISPDNAPADALLPNSAATESELRIYKVNSFAVTVADQLRPLFSDKLQVAADTANGTVLVLGDKSTHEKVATALKSIDETASRPLKDRDLSNAPLQQDDSAHPSEDSPSAAPRLSGDSLQGVTRDVNPGKNRPRGQNTKLAGPDPQEIAQLLTGLYGKQTTISVDDDSGRVLVTINPAVTSAEAQQVLAEIKSTAADLALPAKSSQRTVTIYGTGSHGLLGQVTLDPGSQQVSVPPRSDDQSMDQQARQLAQRYLSANAAEQPAIRKELADLTERHFNLRQAERQREIDEIGRRLEKLRASQQQRQQRKSEVIERRIQDLLDTNSDFWTGESRTSKKPPALGAGNRLKPATLGLADLKAGPANPPVVQDSNTVPGAAAVTEKTFDGVPYSQWMQMLETERKPSKLAMAIDACSRIAKPEDQTRIAHQIIAAAQSFEAGDSTEWTHVWDTSWEGLERLRPDVVASELLAAIHAPNSTQDGRRYQGRTLAEKLSAKPRESLLQQSPKIIDELVQLQQNGGPGVDWLLAGASVLWRDSGRSLDDHPNLRTQMIKMIDDGFGSARQDQNQFIRPEWQIVAEVLIAKAPTTPDLAQKLMKHAGKNDDIIRMIGELGRHAEPVVPLLVDDFVANWSIYERESRLAEPSGPFARSTTAPPERCRDLIAALGKIGVGEKGGLLLRDLRLVLPVSRTRFESPAEMRLGPLAASVAAAVPQWTLPSNDVLPLILNDHTMITGTWRLSDGLPSPSNLLLHFGQSTIQVPRSAGSALFLTEGGQKLGDRFEIDPSAAVKQISFFEVTGPRGGPQKELSGTRRDGIYELTGTKLRVQLGGLAQPRPAAFAKDRAELAEGELLLEFQREIPDWPKSTQIPR